MLQSHDEIILQIIFCNKIKPNKKLKIIFHKIQNINYKWSENKQWNVDYLSKIYLFFLQLGFHRNFVKHKNVSNLDK